jgi:putative CocE/NonD family hydrolase
MTKSMMLWTFGTVAWIAAWGCASDAPDSAPGSSSAQGADAAGAGPAAALPSGATSGASTAGNANAGQGKNGPQVAASPGAAGDAGSATGPDAGKKPRVTPPPGSVSKPGAYSGYGDKVYKGYALSSQYVAVRDGTKLAVDLYRPKGSDGKVVTDKLPVLWMHTPYNRRNFASAGGAGLTGETYPGAAARLIEYGYVVATVDYRGLYASFGTNEGFNRGEWVDAARMDAYDITEWLATQSFSNGNVGMWGCSATGGSQMQALTQAPPHLKAVFPMSCEFDAYPFGVPGGMSAASGDTKAPPSASSSALRDATAQNVDDDTGRVQLRAAQAEHENNVENPGYVPFRDSTASNIREVWWRKSSPHTYLDAIKQSGIAVYLAANWDEAATKYGAFFTLNNLTNPAKLIVGPSAHCAWFTVEKDTGFDIAVEERRFFDYWLKGIDNGVMDEPKIYYYTYNAEKGQEWRSAERWPLPDEKRTPYYLGAKSLGTTAPTEASAKDDLLVDYTVGTGATSTSAPATPKGIHYATEPLPKDVRVTGHPVAELWVASTATDGDFIATLQDVAPDGGITSYNMHGRLRASLRKEAAAPYENLGLPYHPFGQGDVAPLVPGEPTRLRFDLLPISYIFRAGHRIQLTLSFADTVTPKLSPAPTVSIFHDGAHPSSITLPILATP